ncbi:MAG: UDP-4-amino-4,6-dideoxy-N-acetyl-beta-L-altrosamine N-acetyltransferase [Nitrospirota bacterium]
MKNFRSDYRFDDIELINFINLSDREKSLIRRWRNCEDVRKWMYSDKLISRKEHSEFIKQLEKDSRNYYWLVRRNNIYLGVVSLQKVDFSHKNAYLGIYSNPGLSGAGGTLMESLKRIAFSEFKLHTLKIESLSKNRRAINFFSRSGFFREGTLKEFVFKNGKWQDVIIMGIINGKRC